MNGYEFMPMPVSLDADSVVASELYAYICELILRRGGALNDSVSTSTNKCIVPGQLKTSYLDSTSSSVNSDLKRIGYLGHPIIIEFLLLPASKFKNQLPVSTCRCVPAFLIEQWMVQFLPKRLVPGTVLSVNTLSDEIKQHCKISVVNKLLFDFERTSHALKLKDLRCVCRLTNLRRANLFSSCWFTLNTDELLIDTEDSSSRGYATQLFRDWSDAFCMPDGVHTTMPAKATKSTYLCSGSPCSHHHDNKEVCVSRSFSRVSASPEEVLDTSVTSVLEIPTTPPQDLFSESFRYIQDGTMSLPMKWNLSARTQLHVSTNKDSGSCHKSIPKSPVMIMSHWNDHSATEDGSPPPRQQKRPLLEGNFRVHDCITEFTSLTMSKIAPGACSNHGLTRLNVRNGRNSKSLGESCLSSTSFIPPTVSFNPGTRLPLQSSPVPLRRQKTANFDFDESLTSYESGQIPMIRAIAASIRRPTSIEFKQRSSPRRKRTFSTPVQSASSINSCFTIASLHCSPSPSPSPLGCGGAFCLAATCAPSLLPPITSQHLLINFEESMLNGRIPPAGVVEGFYMEIGASGDFFPMHLKLPVIAYFFQLSEDDEKAPSPYLGHVDLSRISNKRGYHVPLKGSIQLTLFNPSHSVMKVFVIQYNFQDMPPNSQTFLRQRSVYMPVEHAVADTTNNNAALETGTGFENSTTSENGTTVAPSPNSLPVFLRYLVHLRFHTTKSASLYLHTDIRLIFARDTFEFDSRVATYELRSFLDGPSDPRYSPKTT